MTQDIIDAADIRKVVEESRIPVVQGHQGDLHLGEIDGQRIFVKAATGNLLSAFARRLMLKREYHAYLRLEGVPGVPHCFGFYDGRYLALAAIEGQTLRNAVIQDRERFYGELFEVIEAMHARGVAHGDLMRRENILVDLHECPVLVDFGVATIYRHGFHPVNHALYRFFSQHDLNAWLKHKYKRRWELVTPEDARYHRRLLIDDLARGIKRTWLALRGWRKHNPQ